MKFHVLIASAFVLTAITSPAKALDADHEFMGLMMIGAAVVGNCPDYKVVDGGILKFGDVNGADVEKFAPPAITAMMAISGGEYDRSKLVPEVTKFMRAGMLELGGEVIKLGKTKFCSKYAPAVVNTGIVKKKGGD